MLISVTDAGAGFTNLMASNVLPEGSRVTFRAYDDFERKIGEVSAISTGTTAVAGLVQWPYMLIQRVEAVSDYGQTGVEWVNGRPAPTVVAIDPATYPADLATEFHIIGTGFRPGAVALVNGTTYQSIFVSVTEVRMMYAGSAPPGDYGIAIRNSDGQISNEFTLTLT